MSITFKYSDVIGWLHCKWLGESYHSDHSDLFFSLDMYNCIYIYIYTYIVYIYKIIFLSRCMIDYNCNCFRSERSQPNVGSDLQVSHQRVIVMLVKQWDPNFRIKKGVVYGCFYGITHIRFIRFKHQGKLPLYRGGLPFQAQILRGDAECPGYCGWWKKSCRW